MLFSGRSITGIQTVQDREKLRKDALEKLQEALTKYDTSEGLRDLFFTEFLVN
jgi:flagellar FliL protein